MPSERADLPADPDTLSEAVRYFLHALGGVAILMAVQYGLFRLFEAGLLARLISAALSILTAIWMLVTLLALVDVHEHARATPNLSLIVGVLDLVSVVALAYLAYLILNWDAMAIIAETEFGTGPFRPEFQDRINKFFALLVKGVAILIVGVGALGALTESYWILLTDKYGKPTKNDE